MSSFGLSGVPISGPRFVDCKAPREEAAPSDQLVPVQDKLIFSVAEVLEHFCWCSALACEAAADKCLSDTGYLGSENGISVFRVSSVGG